MTTQVLLIRHGQTDSNVRFSYMGRSAEPLNSAGREQAARLAARLAGRGWGPYVSSPLRRARQTAAIATGLPEAGIPTHPGFTEIEFGPMTGLQRDEVAARFPEAWQAWRDDPSSFRLPGAETVAEVQERAWAALEEVLREHEGGRPAIVTHDAVIRCLVLRAIGAPLSCYRALPVENTSLTLLRRGERGFYLGCFSDAGHLG